MKANVKEILRQMTLEEKAALCSGLDFWHINGVERLGISPVMVTDGPHGLRKQISAGLDLNLANSVKTVCFPTATAMASSFDRDLIYKIGQTLGKICQSEDVAVILGPGANIKRSPLCGRNFEYFSEDPYLSGEIAAAHIQGVQSQHVGTSLKHFCANNQETRRMTSNSVVDERTLHEIYLAGFEGAVKKGKPWTVMCSYNRINGTYAAENREMLTGVLRDQWGYEGVVVTDWGAVKDRVKGLVAGLDLEMPGGGGLSNKKIAEAVKKGSVDTAVLDKTAERILAVILNYTENRQEKTVFDLEQGHKTAVETAAECAVLLKNDHSILPLNKNEKIAVIGELAKTPRYQGSGSSFINAAKVTSALDALGDDHQFVYVQGYKTNEVKVDPALQEEAVNAARNAGIAVIFAGLPDSFESEGFDRKHIDLPENQNKLIEAISNVQPNTVVVLHNGAPVAMPWINRVPAILEMYLGGEGVGEAAVSLLYGDKNPSGKLAETFPLKLSDNPSYLDFPGNKDTVVYHERIYVGYRYYDKKEMPVLFPFGHGLSYTSFEYSGLKINKSSMKDTESCTVTAKIQNTGNRAGKEAVQLYVRDAESTIDRPIRELKGFEKVSLNPGETQTVSFTLDKRTFAYYNTDIHGWTVESGVFEIEMGSSSRDIRLRGMVTVESTETIPVTFTKYSTIGEIMAVDKGRAVLGPILEQMQQAMPGEVKLGEASSDMMAALMGDMPLVALANFASMGDEQLAGLIAALNG
jgi:beta-glucosidase